MYTCIFTREYPVNGYIKITITNTVKDNTNNIIVYLI